MWTITGEVHSEPLHGDNLETISIKFWASRNIDRGGRIYQTCEVASSCLPGRQIHLQYRHDQMMRSNDEKRQHRKETGNFLPLYPSLRPVLWTVRRHICWPPCNHYVSDRELRCSRLLPFCLSCRCRGQLKRHSWTYHLDLSLGKRRLFLFAYHFYIPHRVSSIEHHGLDIGGETKKKKKRKEKKRNEETKRRRTARRRKTPKVVKRGSDGDDAKDKSFLSHPTAFPKKDFPGKRKEDRPPAHPCPPPFGPLFPFLSCEEFPRSGR